MLKMMNRKLRKSRAVAAMEDDISAERRLDRSPALTAAPRLRFPFFIFFFVFHLSLLRVHHLILRFQIRAPLIHPRTAK